MKIVNYQAGYKTNYAIINGNGRYPDLLILNRICELYNGEDKLIAYPLTSFKRKSGFSALDILYEYLSNNYNNFIFIVDREHITKDIRIHIKERNINIENETSLQGSLLLRCKKTPKYFNLFCSISGTYNCIEENLINLINLQLSNRIDLPLSEKNKSYRDLLKKKINEVGRDTVKKVIRESGKKKFEKCFPDLCAIFREIEENYE